MTLYDYEMNTRKQDNGSKKTKMDEIGEVGGKGQDN
jgi:hypothetical protein